MELNAIYRVVFVFYAHYFAVVGNGCDDEFAWHGFVNNCQGVVSSDFELFRQSLKDFGWVYLFGYTLFAVHHLFCVGYGTAEYFANGLVSKAYAEDWEFPFAFAQ